MNSLIICPECSIKGDFKWNVLKKYNNNYDNYSILVELPAHTLTLSNSLSLSSPKKKEKNSGRERQLKWECLKYTFFSLFLQAVLCFELQVLFSAEWPLAAKDLIDSHPKQWSNHKICLPSHISKKKKSSPNTSCTSGKMLWWSYLSFWHVQFYAPDAR